MVLIIFFLHNLDSMGYGLVPPDWLWLNIKHFGLFFFLAYFAASVRKYSIVALLKYVIRQ